MGTSLTTENNNVNDRANIPSKKLIDRFKAVNEEDRIIMFGFKTENELRSSMLKEEISSEEIIELLEWFENTYMIPFWTGDILSNETDGSVWIVTCVYTDGSIDLISAEGKVKRKNVGTLRNDYICNGQLEKITEP